MRSTPAHRWSRPRSLAVAATTAALVVLATGLPTASAEDPAPAPVPETPAFTVPVDLKPEYQGQQLCAPTPKPGTVRLANLIKATYPQYPTIGMERACSSGGQSEHKDGRALDWMVSVRDADQKAAADAFLDWLLAPDADGVAAANARRLGIMYIGWNDRIWRGYGTTGWSGLFDCQTNPDRAAAGYDNYCHRNHIHISLSWDGAAAMTSFYDGTPVTAGACAAPTTSPTAPAAAAYRLIPIAATRVLDTTTSVGISSRCRGFGPGWSGQRRAVAVKVTGVGAVPSTGVGAVLLRVYPVGTNTLSNLRIWTTGASAPTTTPASTGYAGRGVTSTYVVPVASDGTVRISTQYGATDLAVDVLAYAPTSTSTSATTVGTGNIRVQAPTRAASLTVAAGETVVVPLGGSAGVPTSWLTGVQLQVSATGAAGASGSIRVGSVAADGATSIPDRFTVPVSGATTRSAAATVSSRDGRVAVRNMSAAPVTVAFDVLGWYGGWSDSRSLRFVPRTPSRVVDTTAAVGLTTALAAGSPATATLTTTAAPAGTRGLVLQVQTYGRTASGALVVTRTGAEATGRSAEIVKSVWTTELVMVPLGTDLGLTFRATAGADVRAYVVGYLR